MFATMCATNASHTLHALCTHPEYVMHIWCGIVAKRSHFSERPDPWEELMQILDITGNHGPPYRRGVTHKTL